MNLVIQIGNTDNKLTQYEWATFVSEVNTLVNQNGRVHFFGSPPSWAIWQNCCWVVECTPEQISFVKYWLGQIKVKYKQESIAVITGNVEMW